MSRTRESGAYLGGIGVMLGEADVCPLCGETHPEVLFGIRHGNAQECPKVVLGSFPVLDRLEEAPQDPPIPRLPAGRRIREFETPIPVPLISGSSPPPSGEVGARPRGLSVPWLRPPDLGGMV